MLKKHYQKPPQRMYSKISLLNTWISIILLHATELHWCGPSIVLPNKKLCMQLKEELLQIWKQKIHKFVDSCFWCAQRCKLPNKKTLMNISIFWLQHFLSVKINLTKMYLTFKTTKLITCWCKKQKWQSMKEDLLL